MIPSLFLKQHIGEVESRLSIIYDNPHYIRLIDYGCRITDGVRVYDPTTKLTFAPSGVTGNLIACGVLIRVVMLTYTYLRYLQSIPADLVHHADTLEEYRDRLEAALVKEQFTEGGQLWWRSTYGIHRIRITKVERFHNPKLTFIDLDSPQQEEHTALACNLSLFYRREFAIDPTKEGHYDSW